MRISVFCIFIFFFFKQKTAYEMRISDWSSDVCSSDLDKGLLESSIQRPFHTFDQKELYPDPVDKAAAILESIISNHPFVDGNKRTAYVVARLFLRANNLDIQETQDEKYEFVISAARSEIRRSEERREGKECVSTCRSRWATYH